MSRRALRRSAESFARHQKSRVGRVQVKFLAMTREIDKTMVPEEGVEPTRPCDQRILSPLTTFQKHAYLLDLYWLKSRQA